MDLATATKLSGLPPLSRDHAYRRTCKICGSPSPLFDIVDFNKYCSPHPYEYGTAQIPVNYYRCNNCLLIFTDFIDDWTIDEISRFIYNDDYVKVDPEYLGARARRTAVDLSSILRGCERLRILDYGSGAGVFASDMAKFGYDKTACYDPFSHPERPDGTFDLITCFEVVEHSPQPMETLREMTGMLSDHGAILIGQTTQPANIDQLRGAWWYIAPRNGHVSTFSTYTFYEMARREGLSFRTGAGLYAFSRSAPSRILESVLPRIGPIYQGRIVLGPPENDGDPMRWHALEREGDEPFRWTASAEVDFGAHELDAGVTRLEIPFIMEGRPEFASGCMIVLDGASVPTRTEQGRLVAEVTLPDRGAHALGLRTPEPISADVGGGNPDRRPRGLAIREAL